MRLFVTTATDEIDTYMADQWARPLLRTLRAGGNVEIQKMENPSRESVDGQLGSAQGSIFFGHGSERAIGAPSLVDESNIDQVSGTIVAVACRTAGLLGAAAINSRADAYVGFVDDVPVIDSREIDRLIHDGFAPLMLELESVGDFKDRFTAACETVQTRYFSTKRDDEAFLIGQSAQVLKLSLKVCQRSD